MRWQGRERSKNVEDIRGQSSGRRISGGPLAGGGLIAIVVVIIAIIMGKDPKPLLDAVGQAQSKVGQQAATTQAADPNDKTREFIEVVLRDTEKVWHELFAEQVRGGDYQPPKLRIFSGTVNTGCGRANAQMGPFYCPADQFVYIDPTFFDELARRHKAPGDFAQAYVIAHEVAHHVQEQLGFSQYMAKVRRTGDKGAINRASVRYELQADYLAGVWAHHAQKNYNILEEGDIAEAMTAANQIGDDTLQKMAQGFVVPERFTHGTSEQRVRWFKAGLASGNLGNSKELFEIDYSQL